MSGEQENPPAGPSYPPFRIGPARVHIYGGGITGLTAAHELARRGFRVRVYEPAHEYNENGQLEGPRTDEPVFSPWSYPAFPSQAVGGMARSQFFRVDKGALGNFPREGQYADCDVYRFFYEYSPDFVPTEEQLIDRYPDENGYQVPDERMSDFLTRCLLSPSKSPGILCIRVPPSTDPDRISRRSANADAMRRHMLKFTWKEVMFEPERIIILFEEEAQKLGEMRGLPLLPLEDKEGLLLELVHFLPGEHGFRFFPSYYRHLFSTMVETPLLDDEGRPTGRRVFDNLEPSSFYGVAAQGRRIRFLRRAPSTRPAELLDELRDLAASGYPPSDTLQFTLRIWRYMCTCTERRKAEYEELTWWEYLQGFDPKTQARRYQYSDAFKRDMQFAPRVLAAFDGAWGDARTNGNTLVQLYLNNLLPLPKTDGTLNGPTTQAWLRPWRRYLEEYLRVEFAEARLSRIEIEEGHVVPYVLSPAGYETDDTSWEGLRVDYLQEPLSYFIVATDAATAEDVTRNLPPIGVVQGLRGFTKTIPPNPRGPEKEQLRPETGVLPGHVPWDRFQTLTGIQFFFPTTARLAEGYLYFLDAPWGLSAINSQQYWAAPPIFAQDGFASVLSVDIGNWYVREPGLKSPSNCSRQEIANEVWNQIRKATEQHNAPLPHARQYGFVLPEPAWYHMDSSIRFAVDPATGKERPVENRMPFLVPIVGDWDRRPGPEPWDPLAPEPESKPAEPLPEGLWQAPHGGYPVHWDKLVFAGTYLKTFTRMTTMESANESARHAVNAIIDHYLAQPIAQGEAGQQGVSTMRTAPAISEYGGQGTLTGSPDFRMTPIGEYCRIWDPEKHELPELSSIRNLDAQLFAAGLPHIWDLLHLEPMALPLLSPLDPLNSAEALKAFLTRVRESLDALPKPSWSGLKWPPL
jgi:hypothetical protein